MMMVLSALNMPRGLLNFMHKLYQGNQAYNLTTTHAPTNNHLMFLAASTAPNNNLLIPPYALASYSCANLQILLRPATKLTYFIGSYYRANLAATPAPT